MSRATAVVLGLSLTVSACVSIAALVAVSRLVASLAAAWVAP